MEQISIGDTIFWDGVNSEESGTVTGVFDASTLCVSMTGGMSMVVGIYSVKRISKTTTKIQ